jgi:hypothetical protein
MSKSQINNKFRLPKNESRKTNNVQFTVQRRNTNPLARKAVTKGIHVFFTLAFAGFIGLLSLSCENGMEEPVVTASTFPMESGGIIYGDWTPIRVGFSETMVETDAAYLTEVVKVWDHNFIPVSGAAAWEDNTIYFSPLEKWKSGEKYTCRIHGAFSTYNGQVVGVRTELLFYAVTDKETVPLPPPEIAEVFFLKKTEAGSYEETEYDADEYWNNIIQGECGLKILFTEEMDLSEPKRSLRMEPYRNYEVRVIDNRTLEVYFEAEHKPVKKITLTVKEDMHSLTGEELQQDYDFAFTEWEDDFEIVQFMVLTTADFYEDEYGALPLDDLDESFLIGAISDNETKFVYLTYWFSNRIDLIAAMDSLSKIKLVPADIRISADPSLSEVRLVYPNYEQTWVGLEFGAEDDDPYHYLLNIPGGIDGLNNGQGHYLKGDMIIKLDVVDWDLIDS